MKQPDASDADQAAEARTSGTADAASPRNAMANEDDAVDPRGRHPAGEEHAARNRDNESPA